MGAAEVPEALHPLPLRHGKPAFIRSANGKEFTAQALQNRLMQTGITPLRIHPASPWENGCNERFNGTLRQEILNAEWFSTIEQARGPASESGSDCTTASARIRLST